MNTIIICSFLYWMSAITYILLVLEKKRCSGGVFRASKMSVFTMWCGGALGATMSWLFFRHETIENKRVVLMFITLFLQLLIAAALIYFL